MIVRLRDCMIVYTRCTITQSKNKLLDYLCLTTYLCENFILITSLTSPPSYHTPALVPIYPYNRL